MGRAHFTAVASAFAFGLATAIIAAQAPAGQAPAGQKPAPAPAAQPGGSASESGGSQLAAGSGWRPRNGCTVIQAARAAIRGSDGMTGTATLYEISNSGNGHMVQIILLVRTRLPACTACTSMEPAGARAPTSRVPAAISIQVPRAIRIRT